MNDPELPAADNQDARLTDGFQALREKPLPGASSPYRADFLASGSDAPPQPPPPPAPSPPAADEAEELDRLNAFLGDEPSTATAPPDRRPPVAAADPAAVTEALIQALANLKSSDATRQPAPRPDEPSPRDQLQADLDSIRDSGGIAEEELITETIPDAMVKAQATPDDPLWTELSETFSPENAARIKFAVFCRMRDSHAEGWQEFFEEENIPQLELRTAALADQETRDTYATLLRLRAENAEQEQEPGADEESIVRLISDNDPAMVSELLAQGGGEITSAFDAFRNRGHRNRFLWAVTQAALGITQDQLQDKMTELAQMETDAVAARLRYESFVNNLNIPGPMSIHPITTFLQIKTRRAVAYYELANEVRRNRAAFLQQLANDAGLKFNAAGLLERKTDPARPVSAPPPPTALRSPTPIPDTDFRSTERMPTQGNGFVKDIDELLARGADKVQVPPARLIEFLQDLPVPQGARLQNLQMEILDNRTATAQGEISKAMSTTRFAVDLETRPDGFLQVRTVNLQVAFLHRRSEKDIRDRLQNLILRLQSRLDSEIENQYLQTAGFSIVNDPVYGREFAISFRRKQ